MLYRHTLAIHDRLETVLRLIRTGKFSTPALAKEIGVSIPTISRIVAALREQGHGIQAERTRHGWRYVLNGSTKRRLKGHPDQSISASH
jgi:predicted DNA-binding transcriptional regulator YafY